MIQSGVLVLLLVHAISSQLVETDSFTINGLPGSGVGIALDLENDYLAISNPLSSPNGLVTVYTYGCPNWPTFGTPLSHAGDRLVYDGENLFSSSKNDREVVITPRAIDGTLDFTNSETITGTSGNYGIGLDAYFPFFVIGANPTFGTAGFIDIKFSLGFSDYDTIFASDGSTFDGFGVDVSIYENHIIVGSTSNKAYVITLGLGDIWSETQILTGTGSFGQSVFTTDKYIIIGARTFSSLGRVHIYEKGATLWEETATIDNPGTTNGFGRTIAADGDIIVVGDGTDSYIFFWNRGEWALGSTILGYGDSVSIEGNTVACANTDSGDTRVTTFCVPSCGNCGDDGCGGSCGTCGSFETCNLVNQTCEDINECEDCHLCRGGRTCINQINASYICSPCPAGFNESGPYDCEDIDECQNPEICYDECKNIPGSYACINNTCDYVFIDYCEGHNMCSNGRPCLNEQTGFSCGSCPAGFRASNEFDCVDINECREFTHECSDLRFCLNEEGDYSCSDCPDGYTNDGPFNCIADEDCSNSPCDELRKCFNVRSGFKCGACPPGYRNLNETLCEEINECEEGTHLCQPPRFCENSEGSYTCTECVLGLVEDSNFTCADVDNIVYGISGFPGSAQASLVLFIVLLVTVGLSVLLLILSTLGNK